MSEINLRQHQASFSSSGRMSSGWESQTWSLAEHSPGTLLVYTLPCMARDCSQVLPITCGGRGSGWLQVSPKHALPGCGTYLQRAGLHFSTLTPVVRSAAPWAVHSTSATSAPTHHAPSKAQRSGRFLTLHCPVQGQLLPTWRCTLAESLRRQMGRMGGTTVMGSWVMGSLPRGITPWLH